MKEYHKIQTVYLRDPDTKYKTLLDGQFAEPEFKYLKDNRWEFTEKIDGTNVRVSYMSHGDTIPCELDFYGKTDNSQIPTFLYRYLHTTFTVEKLKLVFGEEPIKVCLYGEGFGNKIQKAGKLYNPNGCGFILFDININGVWLERGNVEAIAKILEIPRVPIVGSGRLLDGIEIVKEGLSSNIGNAPMEGLVMRPIVEMQSRLGKRIITKIKHKDFRDVR